MDETKLEQLIGKSEECKEINYLDHLEVLKNLSGVKLEQLNNLYRR